MSGDIVADRWSYNSLERFAIAFLEKHHPSKTIPIPIEDIIDLKYRIDVVPMAGLRELGVDAFLSRDTKTIYVDLGIYESNNTNRYRFTLAHEFAHRLLHEKVFAKAQYDDVGGWKTFIASIDEECRKWIEYQAYALAGLLLVPSELLERQFGLAADKLSKRNVDIRKLAPDAMKQLAKHLGDRFKVSSAVINKRAVKMGLWNDDAIMD